MSSTRWPVSSGLSPESFSATGRGCHGTDALLCELTCVCVCVCEPVRAIQWEGYSSKTPPQGGQHLCRGIVPRGAGMVDGGGDASKGIMHRPMGLGSAAHRCLIEVKGNAFVGERRTTDSKAHRGH